MPRAVWNAIRADPLEVGEHEDVEQLDAGTRDVLYAG